VLSLQQLAAAAAAAVVAVAVEPCLVVVSAARQRRLAVQQDVLLLLLLLRAGWATCSCLKDGCYFVLSSCLNECPQTPVQSISCVQEHGGGAQLPFSVSLGQTNTDNQQRVSAADEKVTPVSDAVMM
jgi:hypothetical protein